MTEIIDLAELRAKYLLRKNPSPDAPLPDITDIYAEIRDLINLVVLLFELSNKQAEVIKKLAQTVEKLSGDIHGNGSHLRPYPVAT